MYCILTLKNRGRDCVAISGIVVKRSVTTMTFMQSILISYVYIDVLNVYHTFYISHVA